MTNLQDITNQTRFTIKHTKFEDTTGMQKGHSITKSLIKVLDNGVLKQEFTRADAEVWVTICVGGLTREGKEAISIDCKKSDKATRKTAAWSYRKKEGYNCMIVNTKIKH